LSGWKKKGANKKSCWFRKNWLEKMQKEQLFCPQPFKKVHALCFLPSMQRKRQLLFFSCVPLLKRKKLIKASGILKCSATVGTYVILIPSISPSNLVGWRKCPSLQGINKRVKRTLCLLSFSFLFCITSFHF